MEKISVLILTHNSDRTLVRALESVKDFDEIIVIDSGSTDMTEEITHSYMGQFITNRFIGFAEQRNFAIKQAKYDWCLFVDSDEEVTKELKVELYNVIKNPAAKSLYRVFRTEYILGEETKSGHGQSGYQERFFKKSHIQYAGEIHEYPMVDGKKPEFDSEFVGLIKKEARLNHDPNNSISHSVSKLGSYSILKAKEKIRDGRTTTAFAVFMIFNITFFQMFFKSIFEGRRGFMASICEAIHRTIVKLIIYENQLIKKEKR